MKNFNNIEIPDTFNQIQIEGIKNIKHTLVDAIVECDYDPEYAVTYLLNSIDLEIINKISIDEYDQIHQYITKLVEKIA